MSEDDKWGEIANLVIGKIPILGDSVTITNTMKTVFNRELTHVRGRVVNANVGKWLGSQQEKSETYWEHAGGRVDFYGQPHPMQFEILEEGKVEERVIREWEVG